MNPADIRIEDYSYELPNEKIALHPLPERDASRLLIYNNGTITEDVYRNITAHLPAGCLLIFNNTRVVNARLLFTKPSGGTIEIFCLEPHNMDIAAAMQQCGQIAMRCLVGGASKWKPGQLLEKNLTINGHPNTLTAAMTGRLPEQFVITLSWQPAQYCFADILSAAGDIPLPPYIKRKTDNADAERYQTIYAQQQGSVAAPTAGLHFTGAVFEQLAQKSIRHQFVTLHVGAGTFKPVKAARMGEHLMHEEYITVSSDLIKTLMGQLQNGQPVVAVGTTSLRTIESLYWLGVKAMANQEAPHLSISQWDAYNLDGRPTAAEALMALIKWMEIKKVIQITTTTQLLIAPGYRLRVANGIVTNFHQPQSTLLLLVAAVAGAQWRSIYDYALANDFRFLSYGDGCLIWAAS
jgi:S-adenosylmethionine:tRNA ribosyltransferase-isomerase